MEGQTFNGDFRPPESNALEKCVGHGTFHRHTLPRRDGDFFGAGKDDQKTCLVMGVSKNRGT